MTAILKKTKYTDEEYFELLKNSDHKYEYHNGEVFMMAGGSDNHNKIAFNFGGELYVNLKDTKCSGRQSDAKIHIKRENSYVFPDLVVVCDEPQFAENQSDTIINPTVVIEVLSAGTESYDRGDKFRKYQTIASLQHYILVSQSEPLLEMFTRHTATNKWIYQQYAGMEELINISSISVKIALKDIYQNVKFSVKPTPPNS